MLKETAVGLVIFMSMAAGAQQAKPSRAEAARVMRGPFRPEELKSFVALNPIDTHTHIFHPSPVFSALIARLNLRLIDIVVVDDHGKPPATLERERAGALSVITQNSERMKLCTSFDPYSFNTSSFTQHAVEEMNRDFEGGAIAVKVWKNVGMEIKNEAGQYVLPDDPKFQPIFADIAAHNKTLIAHLADPNTLWAPPDPKADDYSYYMEEEPWWYMYNKPGVPSKEAILLARDHILERNPTLRVVGAHLGSLEASFADLGAHFDRYPNFAVDLAGRVPYFKMMPREEAIAFITKYQDRLIYATDNDHPFRIGKARRAGRDWEEAYADQWRYFATSDVVDYQGKPVEGLALSPSILRKLYHDNAVKWFPGVLGGAQ